MLYDDSDRNTTGHDGHLPRSVSLASSILKDPIIL